MRRLRQDTRKTNLRRAGEVLAVALLSATLAAAANNHDVLVVTSTNADSNQLVVFRLNTSGTATLPMVDMLPTGGMGGASGNAGAVQFRNGFGALVNYGSNTVTRLRRDFDTIHIGATVKLAPGCVNPVSVALTDGEMFVAGANCAESHAWPSGVLNGSAVALPDASAGQIAVGESWAAVTMKSGNGSVMQLPLTARGALAGTSTKVNLSLGAGATPLGAAFWGDTLGFNPAHVLDSFALLNKAGNVAPVPGPMPAYPANAPCWLVKGPGSIWYSANSPGQAISIFFSDGQGGAYYKSLPLPGVPTDITLSADGQWLAVIYTAASDGLARVAVFAVDASGDLSPVATSDAVSGVTAFNGVAISE